MSDPTYESVSQTPPEFWALIKYVVIYLQSLFLFNTLTAFKQRGEEMKEWLWSSIYEIHTIVCLILGNLSIRYRGEHCGTEAKLHL